MKRQLKKKAIPQSSLAIKQGWRLHKELVVFAGALIALIALMILLRVVTRDDASSSLLPARLPLMSTQDFVNTDLPVGVQEITSESSFDDIQEILDSASTMYRRGDYDGAVDQYKILHTHYPEDADIANNYANALRKRGDFENAEQMYKKAIELNAQYLLAYSNLAYMLLDLGKKTEATAVMDQGISQNPDAEALLQARESI